MKKHFLKTTLVVAVLIVWTALPAGNQKDTLT
jgi:hypothetical protein